MENRSRAVGSRCSNRDWSLARSSIARMAEHVIHIVFIFWNSSKKGGGLRYPVEGVEQLRSSCSFFGWRLYRYRYPVALAVVSFWGY